MKSENKAKQYYLHCLNASSMEFSCHHWFWQTPALNTDSQPE